MDICICDDNLIHLANIVSLVKEYFIQKQMEEVFLFALSPKELKIILEQKEFNYSVAILDIEMGEIDGIKAAQNINCFNPECRIIFITSFPKYNLKVYEVEHLYFVPKELSRIYLPKALNKTIKEAYQYKNGKFCFQNKGKMKTIMFKDILYFEQKGHNTTVYTLSNTYYSVRLNIHNIMEQLQSSSNEEGQFLQTHKSFAINMYYISEFTRMSFLLRNEKSIPISRSYYLQVKEKYLDYVTKLGGIDL